MDNNQNPDTTKDGSISERTKKMNEMDNDIEKLTEAFNDFSDKYGFFITGFTLNRHKESYWRMSVTMDAELFDRGII